MAMAYYAHRAGRKFALYEAGDNPGGNSRTIREGDFVFDTGAHRLHAADPDIFADFSAILGDEMLEAKAPSRIFHRGRFLAFPLEPLDLLRNGRLFPWARIAWEILTRPPRLLSSRRSAPHHFEELAESRYGRTLAGLFLLNYSEKLWGRKASRLSTLIAGKRLNHLGLASTLFQFLFPGRTPGHMEGRFFYPRQGIGSLFESLHARLNDGHSFRFRSRITRLRHDGSAIRQIECNGSESFDVQRVISTLPLPTLFQILDPSPPASLLALARELRFRELVLGVFLVSRERLTPYASLYFPDSELPFTRLYESKNRSPFLGEPGTTCIVVEIPCTKEDPVWTQPDAGLKENLIGHLVQLGLLRREEVLNFRTFKVPSAYPILETGIEKRVDSLLQYLRKFENLHLLGRNSLFQYTHLHDIFSHAKGMMGKLRV